MAPLTAGLPRDVTEENLQSRARGTILMAVSNKFGLMVVTTGNKSEMSAGYATLYGDMNGGFNPVKDLYKTEVYRLARLRNGWRPEGALGPAGRVIPDNVIVRAPTAELRENQTDQDSLPPYDVLDAVLERLVEREEPIATIVAAGFDRDTRPCASSACSISPNTSAARPPRRQGYVEQFRPRPPLSDHQLLSRSRHCGASPGSHVRARRCSEPRVHRFLILLLPLPACGFSPLPACGGEGRGEGAFRGLGMQDGLRADLSARNPSSAQRLGTAVGWVSLRSTHPTDGGQRTATLAAITPPRRRGRCARIRPAGFRTRIAP